MVRPFPPIGYRERARQQFHCSAKDNSIDLSRRTYMLVYCVLNIEGVKNTLSDTAGPLSVLPTTKTYMLCCSICGVLCRQPERFTRSHVLGLCNDVVTINVFSKANDVSQNVSLDQ